MNLREQLLSLDNVKNEAVQVPEWNATVFVKRLSAMERAKLQKQFRNNEDNQAKCFAYTVASCVCDTDNKNVFTDEDVEAIANMDGAIVELLATKAIRFNKLSQTAVDDEKKD